MLSASQVTGPRILNRFCMAKLPSLAHPTGLFPMPETIPLQLDQHLLELLIGFFNKGHVIDFIVGDIPADNPFCPAEGHNGLMPFRRY